METIKVCECFSVINDMSNGFEEDQNPQMYYDMLRVIIASSTLRGNDSAMQLFHMQEYWLPFLKKEGYTKDECYSFRSVLHQMYEYLKNLTDTVSWGNDPVAYPVSSCSSDDDDTDMQDSEDSEDSDDSDDSDDDTESDSEDDDHEDDPDYNPTESDDSDDSDEEDDESDEDD